MSRRRPQDPMRGQQRRVIPFVGHGMRAPNDDMSQPLDFRAAADLAAFDFPVGSLVANGREVPAWNEETIVGAVLAGRRPEAERRR